MMCGKCTEKAAAADCCNKNLCSWKKKKEVSVSSTFSTDDRFRKFLVRTNMDLFIIGSILALYHATSYASASAVPNMDVSTALNDATNNTSAEEVHEDTEALAILFPWFAEIVGVFVYYVLSRYLHAIPYTAVMFLVGTFIGFSVQSGLDNAIAQSATTWVGIDGEVILLVFLPGLLFLDSYNIDVHLFVKSFSQLLMFAFPMVLGGTTLTALVACYLFDYKWSFDLCMTFGSILAATDPVAVSVLLNELGAPPRLKMHVSGESLMNDGSAVVFYHIFSLRFFFEMGIPGLGEDIGWGQGFALFFRLAIGGSLIGLAFGIGLLVVLYSLNRRLSGEDSVVQVVATITTAYLAFFTSEILAGCSGILAVLFCGLTVRALGEPLYNDSHLSHHFWEITEYLLNTLLFTLGGCVWGEIISTDSYRGDTRFEFSAKDWGFLFMLFVFLILIRFFLVFAFYPATSRMGIGQSIKEAIFMSYGGLRGAVGIALALSLHSEVLRYTSTEEFSEAKRIEYREYSTKLFGMVGGIAFLTLFVLAPTSGLLLKKLGLVTPTEAREKVIENYREHLVRYVTKEYVHLLTYPRFNDVDFTVVIDHIPFMKDLTYEQLMDAVKEHKETTPAKKYITPNLKNVVPYLWKQESSSGSQHMSVIDGTDDNVGSESLKMSITKSASTKVMKNRRQSAVMLRSTRGNRDTVFDLNIATDEKVVMEERLIYINILRSTYHKLIEHGLLEQRGLIVHALDESLEFAEDAAAKGQPLQDWNALEVASDSYAIPLEWTLLRLFRLLFKFKRSKLDLDYFTISYQVRQVIVFVHAHNLAREVFKKEFSKGAVLTECEKCVLDESDEQVRLANASLAKLDEVDVGVVKSHYVCQILLNRAAYYLNKLKKHGLMSEKEAAGFLEEIQENLKHLLECKEVYHTDEMNSSHKMKRFRAASIACTLCPSNTSRTDGLTQAPKKKLEQWNLYEEVSKQNLDIIKKDAPLVSASAVAQDERIDYFE